MPSMWMLYHKGLCVQVALDSYSQWIQLVAELTVNSLKSWQWASSSVYYLLGLWSRLVFVHAISQRRWPIHAGDLCAQDN